MKKLLLMSVFGLAMVSAGGAFADHPVSINKHYNPYTGVTTIVREFSDGSKLVIKRNRFGRVISRDRIRAPRFVRHVIRHHLWKRHHRQHHRVNHRRNRWNGHHRQHRLVSPRRVHRVAPRRAHKMRHRARVVNRSHRPDRSHRRSRW